MKIVILDDYQQAALNAADWRVLPDNMDVVALKEHITERAELESSLQGAEVIVAMRERTPFDAELLRRLPDLRLLVTTGMGNAAIDLSAATELGILVCGTEGGGPATAELAWGLIISLARHIGVESAAIREGKWQVSLGSELAGKTLGLLGLGKLGSHMATIGGAFGMSLIAWSQNLTAEQAAGQGCSLVSKEELFSRSDIVSIHVRLSDRTRGLVGKRELALMKPSSLLVNTSRGAIVDVRALVSALRDHRIAGAGIDVFEEEPLPPDSPLRSLDNALLTPHIGYVTEETYRVFYGEAIEDILAYTRATPVRVLNGKVQGHMRPAPTR